MKSEDVKIYESGNHCFGDILRVNSVDYEDISKEDIKELINDVMEYNINSYNFIKETFKSALEYLPLDYIDGHTYKCEQCGDWSSYEKYVSDTEGSN